MPSFGRALAVLVPLLYFQQLLGIFLHILPIDDCLPSFGRAYTVFVPLH
jgi:hypothetical protein